MHTSGNTGVDTQMTVDSLSTQPRTHCSMEKTPFVT